MHHEDDLLPAGPGCRYQPVKALHSTSFFSQARTEPTYQPGVSGLQPRLPPERKLTGETARRSTALAACEGARQDTRVPG